MRLYLVSFDSEDKKLHIYIAAENVAAAVRGFAERWNDVEKFTVNYVSAVLRVEVHADGSGVTVS